MAVRLLGGDDTTDETDAFMSRYGVEGFPTLLVLNADGHLLAVDVRRSVDAMLAALGEARESEKTFAAAKAREDRESRLAVARMLRERAALSESEAAYRALLKEKPDADATDGLARVLAAGQRSADERALLEGAVKSFPKAGQRFRWRIRLATMEVESSESQSTALERLESASGQLTKLLDAVKAEDDANGVAEVRVALGDLLTSLAKTDDAVAQFDAVIAGEPPTPFVPAALLGKAGVEWQRGDVAACKDVLQKIVDGYPTSEQAKVARVGIERCKHELGEPHDHDH